MGADQRRRKKLGSKFFVLELSNWARLWEAPTVNRMNLVLAYLTMLAGTGPGHKFTKWSAKAIMRYTGMRWDAAQTAIRELIDAGLVERADSWTREKPAYNMSIGDAAAVLFLPVALVTGLTDIDTPILRRIRETRDPLLLRVLMQLYAEVTSDAPHAVRLPALRSYPTGDAAAPVMEIGANIVWELAEPDTKATKIKPAITADGQTGRFWDKLDTLMRIGAVYSEPWLCTDATAEGDPMFPLSGDLREVADEAGRALLGCLPSQEWLTDQHPGTLVALPAHHHPPAVQRLFKLRVETDDLHGRAAYAERERIEAHWTAEYLQLACDASRGIYSRPVRTQPSVAAKEGCSHQDHQDHQNGQENSPAESSSRTFQEDQKKPDQRAYARHK